MKTLSSYEDAYNMAMPYIQDIQRCKHKFTAPYTYDYKLPPEVKAAKWEITQKSLAVTLHYIFDYLKHNCYMLCIGKGRREMFKLQQNQTAEVYEAVIKKSLKDIWSNPKITTQQKHFIVKNLRDKPLRVMQCIVKEYTNADVDKTNEYWTLLKDLALPYGVFILNLTDAVILRKDRYHPFPMVMKQQAREYLNKAFLPILSISGQVGYEDIPIPNYDDVMYVLELTKVDLSLMCTNWSSKQDKAVFRGGPTGCGYTSDTNMRIKLATIIHPLLDVKLSGKGATIDTRSIRYDPVWGLGMLNTNIEPAREFLTMVQQSKYKIIIHIDGNVSAYRLLTTMATGSLILRVKSPYKSWVDHLIKPGHHYVEIIESEMQNIGNVVSALLKKPKSQDIANAGMTFARNALKKKYIQDVFQVVFAALTL